MNTAPSENRLLAALPREVFDRLEPCLKLVPLELGVSLYESGDRLQHVYFPLDCVVSLHYLLEDGSMAEFAVTGKDGVVGISLFMGGGSTPSRAVVQTAGHAYRLEASVLVREFAMGGSMQRILLRYTQSLLTQVTQISMCNRHHSLDKQFSRWLLLSLDLLSTNELKMTHESIASMLGVRREGVTEAAGKLQAAGIIKCIRGRIVVLDRARLESKVCECYAVIKREADRLFPRVTLPGLASPGAVEIRYHA